MSSSVDMKDRDIQIGCGCKTELKMVYYLRIRSKAAPPVYGLKPPTGRIVKSSTEPLLRRTNTEPPCTVKERRQLMHMQKVVREWVEVHWQFPYPKRAEFNKIRMVIHGVTEDPSITDLYIHSLLEDMRMTEWPNIVYNAGGVPLIFRRNIVMGITAKYAIEHFGYDSQSGTFVNRTGFGAFVSNCNNEARERQTIQEITGMSDEEWEEIVGEQQGLLGRSLSGFSCARVFGCDDTCKN